MRTVENVLLWLNILDQDGRLSVSSVALWVVLFRLVFGAVHWEWVGALFVVCLNFMHARMELTKRMEASAKASELAELRAEVLWLRSEVEGYREIQDLVAKQSEEVKKLLSNNNLVNAFKPRG